MAIVERLPGGFVDDEWFMIIDALRLLAEMTPDLAETFACHDLIRIINRFVEEA